MRAAKAVIILCCAVFLLSNCAKAQEKYQATWESLSKYKTPDWFRDAKFGIFIHWGVYSVPAFGSEWYPRLMYVEGSPEYNHHIPPTGHSTSSATKTSSPCSKPNTTILPRGLSFSRRRVRNTSLLWQNITMVSP